MECPVFTLGYVDLRGHLFQIRYFTDEEIKAQRYTDSRGSERQS